MSWTRCASRIELPMAQQRRESGDNTSEWPWATVPDTTVQRMLTHIRELQLRVAELHAAVDPSERGDHGER